MKIKTLLLIALAIAPIAAQAETPADRCEILADYAQGVAKLRDEGVRLSAVKEITAERADGVMLDAFNKAAAMAYRYDDMTPAQVRKGLLTGCLETVNGAPQ
jgi:hypothetical protein